ncbi:hypothetical protein ACIO1C_20285 [Streptomyces sp. NPDC087420]|uniref:hypothetical protein n=1 Tax=Streptomyces sp. NPDC087420 TaxID=3365785 RepID=UPI0038362B2F
MIRQFRCRGRGRLRIGQRQLPAGHAVRQAGVVAPVSLRTITAVIAQYTRDSELRGRCS